MNLDMNKVILDGTLYSLIVSIFIIVSLWRVPRIWLHDFPEDIQEMVPPKTEAEKRLSLIVGIPFLLLLFAGPFLSGLIWKLNAVNSIPYFALFLHVFLIAMFFNAVDWLVLDWLLVCTLTPKWMVIPGTEGAKGYKDYKFHFIGFLKGSVISGISSLIIALVLWLV
jgi:hypothetical protein